MGWGEVVVQLYLMKWLLPLVVSLEIGLPTWEGKKVEREVQLAEDPLAATVELDADSSHLLGDGTISSNVGADKDVPVGKVELVKVDIEAPGSGAHDEDDDLGHGISYCPRPELVTCVVLLGPEAATGCGPFAPGVDGILATGLHCVAQVPRYEEQRTCCHLGKFACQPSKCGGLVPPGLAECLLS